MRRDDTDLPVAPPNDRPNARYRCGQVCGGALAKTNSCPLGPTVLGVCRHEKEACVPVLTATSRSRRFRFAILVAGMFFLFGGTYFLNRDFYKPGPLSTPHAQILAGQMTSDSCAACHPKAGDSPLAWFLTGHDSSEVLQSDRCMDCHHTSMPRKFARTAHNLSAEQLQQVRSSAAQTRSVSWNQWLPRPSFAASDVACSSCHREHAGADASLTSLTNEQCQTCHQNRFTSFAVDHPSWNDWPYTSNEPIAFDHRTHSQRHFPSTRDESGNAATFDCLRCHAKTETGEFARITDYATACGSCHDKALNQRTGERLDLFVLPSLIAPDTNVVGQWPPAATGFYDGTTGPLARLLLTGDKYREAMDSLPGNGDFARVDPDEPAQCKAAETIAVGIRDTIQAMATQGPIPAAASVLPEQPLVRQILKGLPPQLMWDASQRWFPDARKSVAVNNAMRGPKPSFRMAATRDSLLADEELESEEVDPLLADDPLMEADPLMEPDADIRSSLDNRAPVNQPTTLEHNPVTMQPDGGWYVDDSRMAISYRGHGHADPVIQAAIELAAGLSPDNSIRRDLLGSGPALACIECHPGANNVGAVIWKPSLTTRRSGSQFTKFSHSPHMNLPVLADCKHCHQVKDAVGGDEAHQMTTVSMSDLLNPVASPHDFGPITRHACASCHTANAAGDACIKCHVYHTEPITNR